MNRSIILCITSIILLLNTSQLIGQSSNNDYKIVGYVAGWHDWSTDMIDAEKLTHINYAFADIQDGRVSSYLENDDYNYQMLDSLKAENSDLKILVSVGG